MKLRSIKDVKSITGKRVVVRLDLNIPIPHGHIGASDLWKLRSSIATIDYLRDKGAKIIILSHLGRPQGRDKKTSLKPVVKKFSQMIGFKINVWTGPLANCIKKSYKLEAGEVVCLENIRWHKGETKNDAKFAKQLAALGDLYVNDGFGVIYNEHASTLGITKYLPSYAGFLLQYEVDHLYNLWQRVKKPIVAVIGGSKIDTKMGLLQKLLEEVNYLLIGGALANSLLKASGVAVGKSLIDEGVKISKKLSNNPKLVLPIDARVSPSLTAPLKIKSIAKIASDDIILDIGPKTEKLFADYIKSAKTVIWNGPLGYFEDHRYARGTQALAEAIGRSGAREYVGGGETVKAVLQQRLEDTMFFVSTGGGTMLSLLQDTPVKALNILKK